MSGHANPLLFWVFWACLAKQTQNDTSNHRNFFCLFADQKSTLPPCFYGDIAKICKLLILRTLGMPGCTPKMKVSPCRRLRCSSECQK